MKRHYIIILSLLFATSVAGAECASEMDTFNRYQIINKGMLELTLAGKINHTTTRYIGEQSKIAGEHNKSGDYQKACDVYDGVIEKFGFKTFEETYYEQNPDKRPENQPKPKSSSASSSASSSDAAVASGSASDSD